MTGGVKGLVALSLAVAATVVLAPRPRAQQPSLLDRAAQYTVDTLPRLSNIVAEERSVQRMTVPRASRELVSDYLLVQLKETGDWYAFRDVFQVDGKPVRDRDQRVMRLFLDESPGNALEQASTIAREGARHNLRNIGTINSPLLVLAFLQPRYRDHFRWLSPRQEKKLGPDVWSIQYQEFRTPTILKGNGNADVPSHGQIFVEGATGRILKTELLLGQDNPRFGLSAIRVTTTFTYDEALGTIVPSQMEEWYPDGSGEVTGLATYGRFRRFGVTTDEKIGN